MKTKTTDLKPTTDLNTPGTNRKKPGPEAARTAILCPGHPACGTSKAAAALRYFPGYCLPTALRKLRRTIESEPSLQRALDEPGCRKRAHYYTRSQMQTLERFLGPGPQREP